MVSDIGPNHLVRMTSQNEFYHRIDSISERHNSTIEQNDRTSSEIEQNYRTSSEIELKLQNPIQQLQFYLSSILELVLKFYSTVELQSSEIEPIL